MKRGTVEHPKLAALASMLGVKRHVAVGLLEMLWHHTARYAPRGDIGKYKDSQLAAALDWPNDDSGRLIRCLVDCGWLDESQEHRLLVHDWHEHSDGTCDTYLSRAGLNYATGHDARRVSKHTDGELRDKTRQDATCDVTRGRGQNQNQNQNQNGDHPDFARLIEAAKERALDGLTWETWKILLHNYGLDAPGCGLTEAEVVEQLLPAVTTCPASEIARKGAGQWVGWRLDDLVKRRVAIFKKNGGAPAAEQPAAHQVDANSI